MSAIDPIAAILGDLDRPVAPRPEFAGALLPRLLDELRAPMRGARRGRGLRLGWFLPGVPIRLRLALILIALLLLLAGIATATYVGVRTWVSEGPRGIQFQSDYQLATAFTSAGNPVGWSPGGNPVRSFALSPDGGELYAMLLPPGAHTPELVRVDGIEHGRRLHATQVLDLESLNVPNWCVWPFVRPVSVAPNGDVFFVVGGLDLPSGASRRPSCGPTTAMNDVQVFLHPAASGLGYDLSPADSAARGGLGHLLLYVLHPDGSRQLVLSGSDLVRSKLFPPDWMEWQIVASAPDRIWLWVDPAEAAGPQRLFRVIDPNADGDWSDRVVRGVSLPASLPFAKSATGTFDAFSEGSWQLAAEPSLQGDDRSRSVLAAVSNSRTGDFRVYRLADRNDDGDVLDPGDVRLLLERPNAARAQIAPRIVVRDGVAHRQLVVAGLSRPDRVSLVSESGAATDIARAFRGLSTVLAGPSGQLYPITGNWDFSLPNNALVVYRLTPVAGVRGKISASAPAGSGASAPISFPAPLSRGTPLLEFEVNGRGSYTIDADGRGLRKLVAHVRGVCRSVDGRELAYTSDLEVPTEFFTYIAADGGRPEKVTERNDPIVCPFTKGWLLVYHRGVYRPDGSSVGNLIRYDRRTGRAAVVARGVDRYALSPDGTKLVYVGGGRETLQLVDLHTLQRRTLAGPQPGTLYSHGPPGGFGLRWSPDGTRIAYFTGRRPRGAIWKPALHTYVHVLWVRDVTTGEPLLSLAIAGGPPSVSWSPDGTELLVCVADRAFEPLCGAGPARLLLIDLRTSSVRKVARGTLNLVGWAPEGRTFAFASSRTLFLVTADGKTEKLPSIKPLGACGVECPWLGWSPDGHYIGFDAGRTEKAPSGIEILDVRTGHLRVLRPFRPFRGDYYLNVNWWR